MGFLNFFKKIGSTIRATMQNWREIGGYRARFSSFGPDINRSDIVRDCLRPLAEHTKKANARCTDKRIEQILNIRPNLYMNGPDFLAKVRNRLELQNTVFVYIHRDDKGKAAGFYPVPYSSFEALDYMGRLFIRFMFNGGGAMTELVAAWEDLAVLRKDYNESDISGDENYAILPGLELVNTTNEGIANAVKATANLRGILKSTKAMLSPEDIKKQKDDFVKDYLSLENSGGIASLDSTQEFIPIKMEPVVTSYEQLREFRENIYRYFGVNDHIIMSQYTESEMEAFYDARIEPFLVALSLELTGKCFTERERAFGAQIVYESNRLQFASTATKLAMVALVDRGALTPNEWRMMFNLAPVEGGDQPIRRLDTAAVDDKPVEDKPEDAPDNEPDQSDPAAEEGDNQDDNG